MAAADYAAAPVAASSALANGSSIQNASLPLGNAANLPDGYVSADSTGCKKQDVTAALEMGDVSADSSLNRSRDKMFKKHKKLPCPLDKGCEEDLGDESVSFVYLRKLRMLQRMHEHDFVQRYDLNNVRGGRT